MFRLQLDEALPMLAVAGQEGDSIAMILNPHLFETLALEERVELVNKLMNGLEQIRGTVIDIHELREKRQINLLVTAIEDRMQQRERKPARGLDKNPR